MVLYYPVPVPVGRKAVWLNYAQDRANTAHPMADDGYTASELRQRYSNKPSSQRLDDSQLSASQLRARHAVQNREFGKDEGMPTAAIVGIVAVVLVVAAFFVLNG